ncbi:heme transporter CcmC [Jeotgalibacillus malaysiensis]|uniref:Heme response regulator HssR n=1 Tax=Jeotgalibacillus malaysiensis TaxID=1508404 RepID=A0A0B5ANP0_9BACL|nr:response regulator transcription factor [Jeotgalibacillus malaysiensis]AJD90282.1 heme transporter CcmC [Jeotgalibacillus malaysiensis]
MRILVVDDELHIRQLIAIQLQQAGYEAVLAKDAQEALSYLEDEEVSAAIVDVMMPGMTGFELTRILSEDLDIPVILVTAKGQLEDKEEGFLAGSEDYLVKPFEPKELLFRLQAILRRYGKAQRNKIQLANVVLDRSTYDVTIHDETLIIPMKEFDLLSVLAHSAGQTIPRSVILREVWGDDEGKHEFSLNTHITRLRERLNQYGAMVEIQTVRGIGYRLEVME